MLSARPVEGRFRRLRSIANTILIAILFAIPWMRVRGEPLVLLDVPQRKFHVLGLVIFPQELFFLWLIVAGAALALFFFTALAGRLWCGWACPQTVFTDVYAAVARQIQGWSRTGPPRHIAAWRRVATHAAWLVMSAIVGLHIVGYFHSPYDMVAALREGRVTGASMGFWIAGTTLSYLDFAIVRQLFCKYLCPYARFQSVLLDSDSLVVAYDTARGEPRKRGSRAHAGPGERIGDCVDCGLCVAVCPTGIDIRRGLQMECIGCTQCIDACDGVMERVGRPRGLIDYRSLASLEGRRTRFVRPRVAIYGALLLCAMFGFATSLARRTPLSLEVERNRSALFQRSADGRIGNAYTLHVENRDRRDHVYRISIDAPPSYQLVAGVNPLAIPATGAVTASVFVLATDDGKSHDDGTRIGFVLEDLDGAGGQIRRESTFLSPAHEKEDEHEESHHGD